MQSYKKYQIEYLKVEGDGNFATFMGKLDSSDKLAILNKLELLQNLGPKSRIPSCYKQIPNSPIHRLIVGLSKGNRAVIFYKPINDTKIILLNSAICTFNDVDNVVYTQNLYRAVSHMRRYLPKL